MAFDIAITLTDAEKIARLERVVAQLIARVETLEEAPGVRPIISRVTRPELVLGVGDEDE